MEPIDYRALLRNWPVLVVLGLLGAVVGMVLPVGGQAKNGPSSALWCTTASAGAPPGSAGASNSGSLIDQGVSTTQIVFYAQNSQVAVNAAKAVGLNEPTLTLQSLVTVEGPTKKSGTPGIVRITGCQFTRESAAQYTNAFAGALGDYMDAKLAAKQSYQLQQEQQKATQLQDQISALPPGSNSQASSLNSQLTAAQGLIQQYSGPAPTSGYGVLLPAQADLAVDKNAAKSSLASSKKVRAVGGLLAGLLVGAGIILTRDMLDKRLRSSARAEEMFGIPVIAEIPAPAREKRDQFASPIDVSRQPASPAAEAYRMLRMSVLFEPLVTELPLDSGFNGVTGNGHSASGIPGNGKTGAHSAGNGHSVGNVYNVNGANHAPGRGHRQVILVVSAGSEPTRPYVVANLAATYAEAGQRVLVTSTSDLHSTRRIGYPSGSFADGDPVDPVEMEAHFEPSHLDNVWRLSLGHFFGVSGQLVARAPAVMSAARQLADVILVETPPLLAVHDGEALSSAVDCVIVVGECLATTVDEARRAGDLLRRIGAPVLGVVLTNVTIPTRDVRHLVPQPEYEPGFVVSAESNAPADIQP